MLGRRIASLGAALTALTMLASAPSYAAPPSTVGAPGVGDPYFPAAGNGGYDVAHYDLVLSWNPASGRLDGVATITATARQDLTSFNLDFRTLKISKLSVNGSTAAYKRKGQELTVTPARKLKAGKQYTVSVTYFGVPKYVVDPDGSPDGWIPTEDGVFVANEPQGTPSWFPVNDHPTDKATYTISMTVPNGLTAVGNGSLVSQQTSSNSGLTTFVWSEKYPMASYLATITIGKFQVTQSVTDSGLPIYLAVDPAEAADSAESLALLPEIIDFEESIFGPYPFETAGAIVDNAPDVGYALETQTKPVYDRAPDVSTVVHEMAHQWFGDSVSLSSWKDIWLNEGFAGYAEWLWSEHAGGPTAKQIFDQDYAVPASNTRFWNPPPGNPGSGATIFDGTVYERGAMTLQALRTKIGDKAFFWVLKSWARIHKYKNATTADFVALAEHVYRQDLTQFFKTWLYTPGKPTTW